MKTNNIVLVGFPGTGKSTVASALAERLGWVGIDTDTSIEKSENRTIPEIFADSGEPYFRQVESRIIGETLQRSDQVIATGGGAVLAEANRKVMLANSLVIALTANPATIIARVERQDNRPLLQGGAAQRVLELLEKRRGAYDFADHTIDTTAMSVEDIVEAIVERRNRQFGVDGE